MKEEENNIELATDIKSVLDDRLKEDESFYITAEESIQKLKVRYGV